VDKNSYNISVGRPEEKRPLGRSRWEDNINKDLQEMGCDMHAEHRWL
jgi:hypothetical protein